MTPDELDAALVEAQRAGILTTDHESDAVGFRHALLREATDRELGPGARRSWHRRWAEVLEASPGVLAARPGTASRSPSTGTRRATYAGRSPRRSRRCRPRRAIGRPDEETALWIRILAGVRDARRRRRGRAGMTAAGGLRPQHDRRRRRPPCWRAGCRDAGAACSTTSSAASSRCRRRPREGRGQRPSPRTGRRPRRPGRGRARSTCSRSSVGASGLQHERRPGPGRAAVRAGAAAAPPSSATPGGDPRRVLRLLPRPDHR